MIEKVLILTLTSIGLCATMWDGMILQDFRFWIEEKVGEWWAKPLGGCYICTTFWASLAMCIILGWPMWLSLPAMGLSAVFSILEPSHD